jgi:hypothetical protein
MSSILSSDPESDLRDGAEVSPELDQLMRKARKASNFLKALSRTGCFCSACSPSANDR